jgi:hypothetical protein
MDRGSTICLLVQILGPSQSSEMLPLMFSSNLVWALYSSYIRASVFEFWINNLGQKCNRFTFFSTYFRPGSLDMILRFMEELSAIHSVSEVMSSSDRLMKVLVSMIKSPDKYEVSIVLPAYLIISQSLNIQNLVWNILEEMHGVAVSLVLNCFGLVNS